MANGKEFSTLRHFLSYARERGAKITEAIVLDDMGRMVPVTILNAPKSNVPVIFEDMDESEKLSQARILHLKRTLNLW